MDQWHYDHCYFIAPLRENITYQSAGNFAFGKHTLVFPWCASCEGSSFHVMAAASTQIIWSLSSIPAIWTFVVKPSLGYHPVWDRHIISDSLVPVKTKSCGIFTGPLMSSKCCLQFSTITITLLVAFLFILCSKYWAQCSLWQYICPIFTVIMPPNNASSSCYNNWQYTQNSNIM